MKRDLLFVAEQLLPLLDEKRLEMVARNRSIKAKEGESVAKLLAAFVRKADEGTIGKLVVEAVILLSARTQADGGKTLRAAAQVYGIDTDAVALKVKQEFAAKDKARKAAKPEPKPPAKPRPKSLRRPPHNRQPKKAPAELGPIQAPHFYTRLPVFPPSFDAPA